MKLGAVVLKVAALGLAVTSAVLGCSRRSIETRPSSASATGTADGISLERVSSSALRSVGYDSSRRILAIEFHDGSIYHYFDVPEHIHTGLMEASSHGKYFHRHIRNSGYRYRKVRSGAD